MKIEHLNFETSDASCHSLRIMAEAARSGEWAVEGKHQPGGAVMVTVSDRNSRSIEAGATKLARTMMDRSAEFAALSKRSSNAKISNDFQRIADMCARVAERLNEG